MSSASAKVLPQGVLRAPCDDAFHQLRMARLDLYLHTVSRNPEAFVKKVERRRQEHERLVDGVDAASLRGLQLLAADEPREREEAFED